MLYALIPCGWAAGREGPRYFTSYSSVEQAALTAARGFESMNLDPEWCTIIAYDGTDELYPVFLYTLIGSSHLSREPFPSPSP